MPITQNPEYLKIVEENHSLKSSLAELRAEFEAFRRSVSRNNTNSRTQADTNRQLIIATAHTQAETISPTTTLGQVARNGERLFAEIHTLKRHVNDCIASVRAGHHKRPGAPTRGRNESQEAQSSRGGMWLTTMVLCFIMLLLISITLIAVVYLVTIEAPSTAEEVEFPVVSGSPPAGEDVPVPIAEPPTTSTMPAPVVTTSPTTPTMSPTAPTARTTAPTAVPAEPPTAPTVTSAKPSVRLSSAATPAAHLTLTWHTTTPTRCAGGGDWAPLRQGPTPAEDMDVVGVEGETISPEEYEDPGWMAAHTRRKSRTKERSSNVSYKDFIGGVGSSIGDSLRNAGETHRLATRRNSWRKHGTPAPRQPQLPEEDYKVVIRPRGGFDTMQSSAIIKDGVLRVFGAAAYITAPDNTSKGVIRGIPDYDAPEDIEESLVNRRNPTILHARRMGRTDLVVIVFESTYVPHYVYYRGAEYRCVLYRKKHELCTTCGRLGHRADVCPAPNTKHCRGYRMLNPTQDHQCYPRCSLCGKGHLTGDTQCREWFNTPMNNKGPSNRGTTPHPPNRTTKGTAQAMKPSVQDKTTRRRRGKLEREAVPAPSQDFPLRKGSTEDIASHGLQNPVPVPIEDEETGVTTKGDQQHQKNASRRRCKGELGRYGLLCSEGRE
ncbi:hypothetical protein HPB49_010882 [Dermacentor silvarum]|uniref:Uncharacterized protein n=1 Tax=Dermacentor silvarum TaxID=543639 RepID=A0ACB8CWZ3_DERSI|nr:hypothetical protein HPB49_010882 [Dermacentor silvarum]